MKLIITLFFFCSHFVFALPPKPELTQDFWNNPSFVKSFMGDYGFRSEIEPRISKAEQSVLAEVVAKAENQLAEAIAYLENKVDEKSSPALDYALGTMCYQNGRLTTAVQAYQNAIKKFPNFLRAHKNLGLVQLNLANLEPASKSLTKAISLDGDGVTFVALGIAICVWSGFFPLKMPTVWHYFYCPRVRMPVMGWLIVFFTPNASKKHCSVK